MQALSHYSYHKTGGQFVLCDIQGGVSAHGAVLSDPAILSRTMTYGDTDWGPDGISQFFALHQCNHYCNPAWMKPSETQSYVYAVESTTVFDVTTRREPAEQTAAREEEYEVQPVYYRDESGNYYYYYPEPEDDDTDDDTGDDTDDDAEDEGEYYWEAGEYEYEYEYEEDTE